ncbi:MAG: pentapeptide repeat-containing protein [Gammaproteobacteria bacterium]|nr:pentapeptide repeat-containing protein [Gammaproteobacteria bacterium]MDE0442079.1 pentapeptide repeat-containing protein [Gammaproteobacteria bacterium]
MNRRTLFWTIGFVFSAVVAASLLFKESAPTVTDDSGAEAAATVNSDSAHVGFPPPSRVIATSSPRRKKGLVDSVEDFSRQPTVERQMGSTADDDEAPASLPVVSDQEVLAQIRELPQERSRKNRLHFTGVDLSNADLAAADLRWVSLEGSALDNADLARSDLRWSNMASTNLSGAALVSADVRGAQMALANLNGADLRELNAAALQIDDSSRQAVDMTGVKARGADLTGAVLSGAWLLHTDLRGADLRGTDLRGAMHLNSAMLDDSIYSRATQFPPTFDPDSKGMVFVDERT